MTRKAPSQLLRDTRGVAAIEFALWSLLIFGALLPALDFGVYLVRSARLSSAVEQASILGYNMRNANALDVDRLSRYVVAASALPADAVTATIRCNGQAQNCAVAPSARSCSCVAPGLPTTYVPASSCGAPCPSGATSGFYVTIAATSNYRSIIRNPWLDGSTMASAVTVRLP
ncbi:TadE/TadG family type IV pilus assembly protein [Sphingomonas sp. SORGH_AS_0879]|uniref:TadE/TadG family type IV pilus assembly protein n=1 Tax=Sphingomonas sp. SORGH_AS_0879 TaxID=3041790 RepID=UPI0027881E60|nr:TadE/TadG family type IV pilus assembly protein [Sphingomonas sp. SORGH_AS_0879]MDQ1228655.1 Flp pilus assembly protein TadG [Sphingomonas sp. SORGH_AS_0879]